MQGKVENLSNEYALVKLPDGRTINMKVNNLPTKVSKGQEVEFKGEIPPSME